MLPRARDRREQCPRQTMGLVHKCMHSKKKKKKKGLRNKD